MVDLTCFLPLSFDHQNRNLSNSFCGMELFYEPRRPRRAWQVLTRGLSLALKCHPHAQWFHTSRQRWCGYALCAVSVILIGVEVVNLLIRFSHHCLINNKILGSFDTRILLDQSDQCCWQWHYWNMHVYFLWVCHLCCFNLFILFNDSFWFVFLGIWSASYSSMIFQNIPNIIRRPICSTVWLIYSVTMLVIYYNFHNSVSMYAMLRRVFSCPYKYNTCVNF